MTAPWVIFAIKKKNEQSLILDIIEKQLPYEPTVETRNRKPIRDTPLSQWELRIGSHRVFYDIDKQTSIVLIKAIGWKDHNVLYIRGQDFTL